MDLENVARPHLNRGLLGFQHAVGTAGRSEDVTVRSAVATAEQTWRAVADAVAGGVGLRRLRRFQRHLEVDAGATAELPVTGGIGAELVRAEKQRETHLGHLDTAEFDAADRVPLTDRMPAVAGGGGAAAWARLKEVPNKAAPG